jgi:hypothetical protein
MRSLYVFSEIITVPVTQAIAVRAVGGIMASVGDFLVVLKLQCCRKIVATAGFAAIQFFGCHTLGIGYGCVHIHDVFLVDLTLNQW